MYPVGLGGNFVKCFIEVMWRSNRWSAGCKWSQVTALVFLKQENLAVAYRGGRGQPGIFGAVLIVLCAAPCVPNTQAIREDALK